MELRARFAEHGYLGPEEKRMAMRNPGTTIARYVVFEFHASQSLPEIARAHGHANGRQSLATRAARRLRRFAKRA